MRLKLIEIQGFKSFPDKTKLTFERDITAVIGPNGSGKSNISDAIRWVLGEQSNKSLRGNKMEDVIFGGTAVRKPLGFAEVSITIDNTDRGLQFDSDDVTITRRYYRSGESEYRINGAAVRLKDVHELFMDTGLGRDGYSMIGQGRIDEIVGSKSNERRDIFEEAAGISRYRYRKAEAEKRLASAEDNLLRLRDIMAELEDRVGPLAEQSQKAQEFLKLSEQKRELEIGLWLHTLNQSQDLLREQDYKITLVKGQYETIEKELTALAAQAEINAMDSQKITVQIDAIRRESAKAEEEAAGARSEIAVLKTTIQHNDETAQRLQKDIESANQSDEQTKTDIEQNKAEIERIRSLAGEKTDLLNEQLSELNALSDDSGDFSKQIEEKNKTLNAIFSQISETRVKQVTAQTSQNEIRSADTKADENMAALQAQIEEHSREAQQLETDLKRCEENIAQCTNILNGNTLKLKSRQEKVDLQKEAINQLSLDIGETQRRIKILEDLERSMEGFAYAVKTVVRQAENGTLRGIHGPVSRLIGVSADYALAVETALGAAAQNVVTGNEEDAKRAILYLKNNNAGRATFLPLTSIRANPIRESGMADRVGYVGIAAELVTCDKQYREIVDNLLGRTVVCEDMDSAVALAKKFHYRYRVVTLDGQVVNAGGSLTGGSHAKNAGLLNRAGKIESFKEKLKTLTAKMQDGEKELKKLTEEAAKVDALVVGAQSELVTANEDKIRVESELRINAQQLENANAQFEQLKASKADFQNRLEQFAKTEQTTHEQLQELEQQKTKLEEEIHLLTGGRDKLHEKRNALSEEIAAIRLQLIGFTKDIEAKEQEIQRLQSLTADREQRVQALQTEIESLHQKNEQIKTEIEQLEQATSGLIRQSENAGQEIEKLTQQRTALEQASYQSRNEEREKSHDREKLGGELARLQERRETMEKEYDEIIAKLFDEYELTKSQALELNIVIEDIKAATSQLNDIRRKIKALGNVNLSAIEEYKEVSARYEFMKAQLQDVETSRNELHKLIHELTATMKEMFILQFHKINGHFSEVFKELFGGGSAKLQLTDENDVLNSGIDIIAQPPGKNISIIEQLSGGEKALIAVAIYFAIMKVNPPPFCLLDEVEAALDEVNVDKVAAYLRKMSKKTQFIVITHRRGTMEEADVLYGVTMQEKGVSKLLSIDVSQIEKTLQAKPK